MIIMVAKIKVKISKHFTWLYLVHNYYYSTLVLVQYQCCDRLHFRYQNGQFLSYPVLDVVIQCSLLLLFQLSICLVSNTSIFLPYYICLSMFRYVRLWDVSYMVILVNHKYYTKKDIVISSSNHCHWLIIYFHSIIQPRHTIMKHKNHNKWKIVND